MGHKSLKSKQEQAGQKQVREHKVGQKKGAEEATHRARPEPSTSAAEKPSGEGDRPKR